MRLYDMSPVLLRSWIATVYMDSPCQPPGRARSTPSITHRHLPTQGHDLIAIFEDDKVFDHMYMVNPICLGY